MSLIPLIICTLIVFSILTMIKRLVSKRTALKDTDINTDLKEFRESHAVTQVINSGNLNLKESIVQRYERMCILDPVTHKNDPYLPELIESYRNIISGKVLDPLGLNVPSEELLGRKNQDYLKYITNQKIATKRANQLKISGTLKKEGERIVRLNEEDNAKNQFYAYLVEHGIPLLVAISALTETRLNSYDEKDWENFCKSVKGYLSISDRKVVQDFLSSFDEKEIVFNLNKFEQYAIFHEYNLPIMIVKEIINERITSEQAIRIISLYQGNEYEWEEAMKEVITHDLNYREEKELRDGYGWEG